MKKILGSLLLFLLSFSLSPLLAQSMNSADLRGTVTDATGALVPGVKVSALNINTGVETDVETNSSGIYDTSSIISGRYKVTFTKEGFTLYVRGPITLQTGYTTVNAQLKVGSTTQEVVVTADVPLLQTESGEKTETWNTRTLDELPQVANIGSPQGQDWENFMVMLPGMTGTSQSSYGVAGLGQSGSANGSMPYNNVLLDGVTSSLGGGGGASPTTLEAVAELQVSLSNFSAQYGQGGVIINQVTKGGTNEFHGSAYDYIQNTFFNAADYGFGNAIKPNYVRYNNFGGLIDGPIIRKKLFFSFDYERVIDNAPTSTGYFTIPDASIMSGDFTNIAQTLYDPFTQTIGMDNSGNLYPIRQSFASEYGNGNKIPQSLINPVALAMQGFYPTSANHIPSGQFVPGIVNGLGVDTNNFYSSMPQKNPFVKYFGRLDYDITGKNRISVTESENDNPNVYPSAYTACPVGCEGGDVGNIIAQITDVWSFSDHLINEARMGFTWQGNWFNDLTLNQGYASKVGWQFGKADDIPSIGLTNYSALGPAANATGFENIFEPSDVVTLIKGKHILHFGGEFLAYRINYTAWGNINAGAFNFSGAYTQQWALDSNNNAVQNPNGTTGFDYADFLLGTAQAWSAGNFPEYGGRLKSPQLFIQDDWKIRPNLTINLGLRYQGNRGLNEVHGNVNSFDPTVMNPAGNTLGAIWYGTTKANGRSDFTANQFNIWLPRFGFAWSPKKDTTINGGLGWYTYNFTLDQNGDVAQYYGLGVEQGLGGANSTSGNANDQSGVTPVVNLGGNGNQYAAPTAACNTPGCGLVTSTNALPYVNALTTPDAYNGQAVGYYAYHIPVPREIQWNLTLEHMLGTNSSFNIAYVGSHGYNLGFLVDLNQVPQSQLQQFDTQYQPYSNYLDIVGSTNNAISNYNSLQAVFNHRFSGGLSFSTSYVWSHFLDEQETGSSNRGQGSRNFQNSYNPRAQYGNSNFDTRNAFKAYGDYELPLGRGKAWLNTNPVLNQIVGGWDLAFTEILMSGTPFTLYVMPDFSYSQTSNVSAWYPDVVPGVSTKPMNRNLNNWYNVNAFQQAQPGTFGNMHRNSLYGPGINETNLSLSKAFELPWENLKLKLRMDATNAFNHPSFGQPNSLLTGVNQTPGYTFSSSPSITSTQVGGRLVQLGAHIAF